jgi:hypothetical protein
MRDEVQGQARRERVCEKVRVKRRVLFERFAVCGWRFAQEKTKH